MTYGAGEAFVLSPEAIRSGIAEPEPPGAVPDRLAIEHGSKLLFCRTLLGRTGIHFGGVRSREFEPAMMSVR
ncbi:hypothetical protein GCM10007887_35000 [Methylobacterium haplocladii]|uniref:Uncharacterized protein n=1 Tax=Methylobacterium haplocladii TaxID=1176176 RepID=A0A512IU45_9HYPH|nr:hypothetical protein MHA02_36120 [Methylobacterium haplocladii]GLS60812.1 hypothetical protein GCM10007887_35000 [Methylobacterium haplocladii]